MASDFLRSGKIFDLRVPGFRAAGVSCGIKKNGRKDLAVIVSDSPARVAGVFTTNSVKAAPVLLDMKRVRKGTASGIIVNSGNANACTGREGLKNSEAMAAIAEKALGLRKGSMLVASTGVIGVPLPIKKIESGMPTVAKMIGYDGLHSAVEAMMTTDAFPKKTVGKAKIGGSGVTVAGIAKGAGMICPNMATMLAFFMTDANIKSPALSRALKAAVDRSFNSIIVDNDTSTNDTVLIFANGSDGNEIKDGTREFAAFTDLLTSLAVELSHMIVRDGEGATRFVEIEVAGAATDEDARLAARTVAESMLCKTAFFGGDPNWGRIIAAIGRSGAKMKEERTSISINGVKVASGGLDTGKEKEAARAMKTRELYVKVSLGAGKRSSRVWTSDLTYEYVKINSAYRT
ncbi:MAG: bifunctional ornithine acetyltransferase/N-acetylglutamate synthase [Deltaproteobacteria bacterium GWC2_55_46]|nr:MAG: bifunctional ornithine acetyltransferase/N-acetylglutamate synthase [Deltaproteobacteria bacterium GWA2_55_82]OGQ62389.1 MAG: bifunctional ornithine acetyltransferase/N-acetylglutamate synthase [Deltaproteobacteria bacterium RIFCSPLOWO2_02_FULL_55_12]OIJ73301.1 MAG: bifunctional ornithine acetyltransferase/N-acetylglutamate synthase [Deltaproteobacteria bacterium GWC2_55_46]